MGLPAIDDHLDSVRARHGGPRTIGNASCFDAGKNTQPENDIGFWIFQDPLLDHQSCTALFACWRPFFGRLEDQFDLAFQPVLCLSQYLGYSHENRNMAI